MPLRFVKIAVALAVPGMANFLRFHGVNGTKTATKHAGKYQTGVDSVVITKFTLHEVTNLRSYLHVHF